MKLSDPNASAQKWATNLGGARQAYIDGVNSTPVAPGQLAAAATDRWLANTQAAAPRYKANSQAVTKEQWASAAINKGADRLSSGAAQAQPKMASVFTKLFPAIHSEVQALGPRGTIDQNIARSAAFARAMNKRKGTFK
jgi:hypothetical protein